MRSQVCKGLSSPQRCDKVTHSRAPLDSTPIYPITRSPENNARPVEKKTYQDHTFALRIPLELDDDDLDSLKLEHLLIVLASTSLMETSPNASPYTMMGEHCKLLSS